METHIKNTYVEGNSRWQRKWLFFMAIALLAMIALAEGLRPVLLEILKDKIDVLQQWRSNYPLPTMMGFAVLYTFSATVFLPVHFISAVMAGAVFGIPLGTVLVAVASLSGASANFLLSRYVLYPRVKRNYRRQMKKMVRGLRRYGWMYLAALRLFPGAPATAVNLVAGVLPYRLFTFQWVTLVFSLPLQIFYVSLGLKLLG